MFTRSTDRNLIKSSHLSRNEFDMENFETENWWQIHTSIELFSLIMTMATIEW